MYVCVYMSVFVQLYRGRVTEVCGQFQKALIKAFDLMDRLLVDGDVRLLACWLMFTCLLAG